jgi:hypothetical protein
MVLALLTASFVSIVCFFVATVSGFMLAGRAGVGQHFLFGFFTTFLVALAQSMTMFYFIGTGKHVKDLVANNPGGKEFVQRTKVFKAKAFPPATWAILFTMATMILGGGVDTRVWWAPPILHGLLAAISLYFNIVAFWREAKYMIEHNVLMEELDRFLQAAGPPTPTRVE